MAVTNDPKSIFLAAVEKTAGAERDAYLESACGGDDRLRDRVEALLKAHDEPESYLERPLVARDPFDDRPTLPLPPITEKAGSVIGHYKLLEQIGEGGFGAVYLAEQSEPVRRRVALKIIKPGMDSRQVIARFEAERQALAMMDHQNIARVLDAGTTGTGRPYFVMELVKGVPITQYCDAHKLSVRERLELFVPICQAIQHAHQKGVIHRDVKPSNVLVCLYDGKPVPKVIDFGVAKAIEQRLTEKTMFTQHGQIVGTLEYMSPEQAELSQLDIDTRSDVYSLGVLLYELLTGTTPLTKEQLRTAGFAEMLCLIRETEPEKPSTRLSHSQKMLPNISALRRTEPTKLGAILRGELDWIVMRALEKDRTRRYETASALARDIARHLADEPVEACPPSAAYRVRKFVRKHRGAIFTAAAVAGVLLVATIVSLWQAVRATRAEANARQAAQEARANEMKWLDEAGRANDERDKARVAEERANVERGRALEMMGETLQELGRSLYHNARTLLASDQPGRRWATLEAVQGAHALQNFDIDDLPDPDSTDDMEALGFALGLIQLDELAGEKPTVDRLRSQAVAALLLNDGHVVEQWDGLAHAVSPDGRFAASAYVDLENDTGGLLITELPRVPLHRWEGDDAEPLVGTAIALGPEGRRLASLSLDMRTVTIWELPEKNRVAELSLPTSTAASGQADREDGAETRTPFPFSVLRSMSFSPDGRHLAGIVHGSSGAQVVLWELANGGTGQIVGSMAKGTSVASFSPDSRLLAFASRGNAVVIWNVLEKHIEREIELPLTPDGALGFAPDGRLGVHCFEADEKADTTGTGESMLFIWDLEVDREIERHATGASRAFAPVCFSPDGARVAVADAAGGITVLDRRLLSPIRLDHGAMPQLLAWTADGAHLLSGGLGSLRMWAFAHDLPDASLELKGDSQDQPLLPFVFSPNGQYIAAESRQAAHVHLFDATSGTKVRTLEYKNFEPFPPYRLAFDPAAKRLARIGYHGLVVWDVASGESIAHTPATPYEGSSFFTVGFAEEGNVLTGGMNRFSPAVWNASQKEVLWQGTSEPGGLAIVSLNGRWSATFDAVASGDESKIGIWALPSGQSAFDLPGAPQKSMQSLGEFSPDGRWLLAMHMQSPAAAGLHAVATSFGGDGVRYIVGSTPDQAWVGDIWNVATGERHMQVGEPAEEEEFVFGKRHTPLAETSSPLSYVFSPDGRYLAMALRNGTIQLWDVDGKRHLFDWQPGGDRQQRSYSVQHVTFTADSRQLVVPEASAPILHQLDLDKLNEQLADVELAW